MKKPTKTEQLKAVVQKDATTRSFAAYQPSVQVPVSFRLDRSDRDALVEYAAERGLKPAQVLRAWVLERMNTEGLR